MQKNNAGQFTKNSINTVATQFITLAASVLTSIVTARVLGPEGKGQLTLILLVPMLSMTFGRMGIGHAVNYYASKTSATKLIVNSFILSLVISLFLVAVTLPIANSLKNIFFKEIDTSLIIIITCFVPFYILNNHFISLLQGLYKIKIRNLLLVTQSVVNFILLILLTGVLFLNLESALAASIAALILVVILSAIYLLKDLKTEEIRLDFNLMKQLLNFGFKSHIGNILKDLSYRSDILIISYFLSARDVGYYAIAVTIAEVLWKIPDAVGTVLLPRVAQMNSSSARLFTPVVSRIVFIPVLLACLLILLLSRPIIIFAFGKDFIPAIPVLIILLPGILAFAIWKIIANDLLAQGHPVKYSFTSGVALVTMILLDLLLIPKFGINGAAIASTLSYIAATVSIIYIYTRLTDNSLKVLIVPERSDFLLYKKIAKGVINV